MKRCWQIEWGRAVTIAAIICVFNLILYKTQRSWLDWVENGVAVAIGIAIFDFVFVRKATIKERFERIHFLTALFCGFFAAVFSKATH